MQNILNKPIVLSLNRAWQIIGHRTVKQALVALNGGGNEMPPALGIDIEYGKKEDGDWDFDSPLYLNPIPWDEWIKLPVRDFDMYVSTPRQQVRVPTVMVSTQYEKMPVFRPRLTREAILQRDKGVCQYTGEYVGTEDGNLDHIIPRARGGADTFENLVWARRDVNTRKGNRLPQEAGLTLIRAPKPPPTLPVSARLLEPRHPDWRHFMHGHHHHG
jgi:5-methylcytosine-specific restriction endonuclease McrA